MFATLPESHLEDSHISSAEGYLRIQLLHIGTYTTVQKRIFQLVNAVVRGR